MRFQLQLVANLGKLYGAPLNPDDPEDILTIIAFALGGSAAETAGKFGMKVGGRIAKNAARESLKTLANLKHVAARLASDSTEIWMELHVNDGYCEDRG